MTTSPINKLTHSKDIDCRDLRLQLKKVQIFSSPDGGGFNADVYWDGKKIATAHQGGYGGPTDFYYEPHWKQVKDEVTAYVDTLPAYPPSELGTDLKRDFDWVVEDLVNWHDTVKWLKRNLKTKVMFQLVPADGPDWPADFRSWTSCSLTRHTVEQIKQHVLTKEVPHGMKAIFADAFV